MWCVVAKAENKATEKNANEVAEKQQESSVFRGITGREVG